MICHMVHHMTHQKDSHMTGNTWCASWDYHTVPWTINSKKALVYMYVPSWRISNVLQIILHQFYFVLLSLCIEQTANKIAWYMYSWLMSLIPVVASYHDVKRIDYFRDIPMGSQTTDIMHFAVVFHYDVTTKALETLQSTANYLWLHNEKQQQSGWCP